MNCWRVAPLRVLENKSNGRDILVMNREKTPSERLPRTRMRTAAMPMRM